MSATATVAGLSLTGFLRRLPWRLPPAPVTVAVAPLAALAVGGGLAALGGGALADVLAVLPSRSASGLAGVVLVAGCLLATAMTLPTLSPSDGRARLLGRLPVPTRRLAVAHAAPAGLAWLLTVLAVTPLLTTALVRAGAGRPVPLAATLVAVALVGAAGGACATAAATRLCRTRPLRGCSVATVTSFLALAGLAALLGAARALLAADGGVPVASGAVVVAVAGAAVALVVAVSPAFLTPRQLSGFGRAGGTGGRLLAAAPSLLPTLRAHRSPRVRELRSTATLLVLALLTATALSSALARAALLENLLFVAGALAAAVHGLTGAGCGRRRRAETAGLGIGPSSALVSLAVAVAAALACVGVVVVALVVAVEERVLVVVPALVVAVAGATVVTWCFAATSLPVSPRRTVGDGAVLVVAGASLAAGSWLVGRWQETFTPQAGAAALVLSCVPALAVALGLAVAALQHDGPDTLRVTTPDTPTRPTDPTDPRRTR